uniref:Retrotransposon gag domain-containing protein n=2 Tax=Cajanus cajan TaxID=3821 RepID=A0A151RFI2_CAJCA|nr:hypothetical protein KK1_037397 [Cajanus cajan]
MTRSNPGTLHDFDPKIERTLYHRLRSRSSQNNNSSIVNFEVVINSTFNFQSCSNSDTFNFQSCSSSETDSKFDIMANNRELTLKELVTPNVVYQPWCVQYPDNQTNYELKSGLIHLLPKFHGLAGEDPHKHLNEFHVGCSTMRPQGVPEDHVKMKAFPFSLDDVAKDWLYFLPATITTWNQMKRLFLEKFFPASKTTTIRKEICGIRQLNGETLYEYWERFNKLCATCPQQQISEQLLIQYFYEGLTLMNRNMIDAASGGALMDKTPNAARQLISNMAANTQQFGFRGTVKGVNEMAIGAGSSSVCGVDNQRLENKINELTTMVRHLEIEQKQQASAASEGPATVCGICSSEEHYTHSCPTLQETNANVSGIYTNQQQQYRLPQQQQNYNPYSQTYNPGWKDHPNMKWGQQQQPSFQPSGKYQPPFKQQQQ